MWAEFKQFIARGNVIDLAVAVIIGAAFGKIVASLVDGILMPPIGRVLGRVDFSSLFLVLDRAQGVPASLADAKAKGVPVIAYGAFINDVINFLIIAFAVFVLVKAVTRARAAYEKPAPAPAPTTRECPRCLSTIPIKASKCAHCTADLTPA
jgi:large conductance mechanosensitive channel